MHAFSIFLAFLLCQALAVFLRGLAVKQSKLNGITSVAHYLAWQAVPIANRLILTTLVLFWWMDNPDVLTHILSRLKFVRDYLGDVSFPLNPATAGAFGYLADSLVAKLGGVPYIGKFFSKDEPPPAAVEVNPTPKQ